MAVAIPGGVPGSASTRRSSPQPSPQRAEPAGSPSPAWEGGELGGRRHHARVLLQHEHVWRCAARREGLAERFSPETDAGPADLAVLENLHGDFARSLVVTEPQRVAVGEFEETLAALYKAYVSRPSGGSRGLTKGAVIDRVVNVFRAQGLTTKSRWYVDDFIFDVVVVNGGTSVVEVLSFASPRKDWTPLEREAGHFLYAVQKLQVPAKAIVQPPAEGTPPPDSYERITGWFRAENVECRQLDELVDTQQVLDFTHA
jgi:hypothetical protein